MTESVAAQKTYLEESVQAPVQRKTVRHSAIVRATHWITTLCCFALLLSGVEILISHPRFYWGETGNVLTEPWLKIPIPSSRALVPSGYGYVLPDQNGWSRSLHFQAAWLLVLTGLLFVIHGLVTGHIRQHLLPFRSTLSWKAIRGIIAHHLRFERPYDWEELSYNVLQRLTYLLVIFVLFPLLIWTGLALSPAFDSAVPQAVTWLGGRQSARSLHFLATIVLVLFLTVHVVMVWRAGFIKRVKAMITGRTKTPLETQ